MADLIKSLTGANAGGRSFPVGGPAEKVATGDTIEHRVSLGSFPASDWALTFHLRGPSDIDLPTTADGDDHLLTVSGAASSAWAPGRYWWQARLTDGTEVITAGAGELEVTQSLADITGTYDGRSENEKRLAMIDEMLAGTASKGVAEYSLNGRSLKRYSVEELLRLRGIYKSEVEREKRAARHGNPSLIRVRFP